MRSIIVLALLALATTACGSKLRAQGVGTSPSVVQPSQADGVGTSPS